MRDLKRSDAQEKDTKLQSLFSYRHFISNAIASVCCTASARKSKIQRGADLRLYQSHVRESSFGLCLLFVISSANHTQTFGTAIALGIPMSWLSLAVSAGLLARGERVLLPEIHPIISRLLLVFITIGVDHLLPGSCHLTSPNSNRLMPCSTSCGSKLKMETSCSA
jgi:hypothetical protein